MTDYKSMRDSSIKERLSKLSYNAGPKGGDNSHSVAVVDDTGPKVAEQFLRSEGATTAARSDRAPRKRGGRTMKKADGGKVKHDDEAEDRAMIKRMVKADAMTGKKDGGRSCYADGGAVKTKGKGDTTINIVMPSGGDKSPMPIPVPMGGGAPPAPRPMPQPPMGGPSQQSPTPTLALKTGGRANFTAGAGTGEGRLEKTAHAKARG